MQGFGKKNSINGFESKKSKVKCKKSNTLRFTIILLFSYTNSP